jgi:hypothetical protein
MRLRAPYHTHNVQPKYLPSRSSCRLRAIVVSDITPEGGSTAGTARLEKPKISKWLGGTLHCQLITLSAVQPCTPLRPKALAVYSKAAAA